MHNLKARYGDWAVVTGGSSGIGEKFAEKLAGAGMNLILAARRIAPLNDLADRLASQYGVEIVARAIDLSRDGCTDLLANACEGHDIGLVISNAGTGVPGRFSTGDLQCERDVIRLNCITPLEIAHHFLPSMQERKNGAIVFVSSLMGFQGVPYMALLRRTIPTARTASLQC